MTIQSKGFTNLFTPAIVMSALLVGISGTAHADELPRDVGLDDGRLYTGIVTRAAGSGTIGMQRTNPQIFKALAEWGATGNTMNLESYLVAYDGGSLDRYEIQEFLEAYLGRELPKTVGPTLGPLPGGSFLGGTSLAIDCNCNVIAPDLDDDLGASAHSEGTPASGFETTDLSGTYNPFRFGRTGSLSVGSDPTSPIRERWSNVKHLDVNGNTFDAEGYQVETDGSGLSVDMMVSRAGNSNKSATESQSVSGKFTEAFMQLCVDANTLTRDGNCDCSKTIDTVGTYDIDGMFKARRAGTSAVASGQSAFAFGRISFEHPAVVGIGGAYRVRMSASGNQMEWWGGAQRWNTGASTSVARNAAVGEAMDDLNVYLGTQGFNWTDESNWYTGAPVAGSYTDVLKTPSEQTARWQSKTINLNNSIPLRSNIARYVVYTAHYEGEVSVDSPGSSNTFKRALAGQQFRTQLAVAHVVPPEAGGLDWGSGAREDATEGVCCNEAMGSFRVSDGFGLPMFVGAGVRPLNPESAGLLNTAQTDVMDDLESEAGTAWEWEVSSNVESWIDGSYGPSATFDYDTALAVNGINDLNNPMGYVWSDDQCSCDMGVGMKRINVFMQDMNLSKTDGRNSKEHDLCVNTDPAKPHDLRLKVVNHAKFMTTPGMTQKWSLNGEKVPGSTTGMYLTVTEPGLYRVEYENPANAGCVAYRHIYVPECSDDVVGWGESHEHPVSIIPDPSGSYTSN